ncbi:MAG: ATP-binding protein [Candidatus Sedimenticola sp. 6PFRAG1]
MNPLIPEQLYHRCETADWDFDTTESVPGLEETIGQERALDAINFGVGMGHEGYNLYVMGSTGLGRHTVVRDALSRHAEQEVRRADWCYVANFKDSHIPYALRLPAGIGRQLHDDMEQLIGDLLRDIPAVFQNDEYRRRVKEINAEYKEHEQGVAESLGKRALERGIAMIDTPTGYTLAPEIEGKVLDSEEFQALSEEDKERISSVLEEVKEELKEVMGKMPLWQHEVRKKFIDLDREFVEIAVDRLISELEKKYSKLPDVIRYFEAAKTDIIDNHELFKAHDHGEQKPPSSNDPQYDDYRVNLLVDNTEIQGAPIVYEDNPTYQNLLGRVEHFSRMGTLMTDFTLIKPGALHRANGGFLIIDVEKILSNPFAWEGLKRVLNAREIRIESLERQLSLVSTITLEPEPIPIDLKVILIGDRLLYYLLKEYDPEFGSLFKVAADFSEDMARSNGNDLEFARLVATLREREKLRHIENEGVARIIEFSARRADDGEKLSLHMGSLLDLLRESDYWAAQHESEVIRREDVQTAIDAQTQRVDQLRERLHEEVLRGTLKIDTEGVQLAQVNGLSVLQVGDYMFGMPTRISATARLGSGELIDIEREIEQGGSIHSKGVLILASYIGWRYAKNQPFSVSASLVFEQTYGEIEGDSASTAELCALLSAFGDIPIRQALAITGSVNQHGEVQAIGGVCQKIEGFFDICKARGLTNEQGVIIPKANIKDLMLRQDVIDAVENDQFAVYAVSHVEEAMTLLSGLEAGVANADGEFPEQSFNGKIQARLARWTTLRQQYAGQGEAQDPSDG